MTTLTKGFCKNCKYFKNDIPIILNYGKCQLSKKTTPEIIDPISGHKQPEKHEYGYASIYRNYECKDAKFYEYEPSAINRFINQHFGTTIVIVTLITYYAILILWFKPH